MVDGAIVQPILDENGTLENGALGEIQGEGEIVDIDDRVGSEGSNGGTGTGSLFWLLSLQISVEVHWKEGRDNINMSKVYFCLICLYLYGRY